MYLKSIKLDGATMCRKGRPFLSYNASQIIVTKRKVPKHINVKVKYIIMLRNIPDKKNT